VSPCIRVDMGPPELSSDMIDVFVWPPIARQDYGRGI